MPVSEARRRANDKWDEKQDNIRLRVPKGEKEIIQKHASGCNESINGFIVRAIHEAIARDNEKAGIQ